MTGAKLTPLAVAAAAEAATGVALLVAPSMVVALLLGAEISGAGVVASRIAGIALIALGIACWPGGPSRGLLGMTVYSVCALVYMTGVGLTAAQTGWLWWPAVGAHAVLAILLVRALLGRKGASGVADA